MARPKSPRGAWAYQMDVATVGIHMVEHKGIIHYNK